MATMDDIARSLGVSKGTVSKALSGAEDISETMRKTVVERAVELGYTRVSRSGRAKKVCVFVMHMAYKNPDDFGYEIIVGFRKLAEPAGYTVDVIELDEATQRETTYDEYMLRRNYKGALFLALNDLDPWMESLRVCRTPTVLHDNPSRGNPIVTQIGVDNAEAMQMAVGHLANLGHQRIGYLGSGDAHSYIYTQRQAAFFEALRLHALSAEPWQTGFAAFTADCVRAELPRLLEMGVTAIVCNHDVMANAVITHGQELGVSVPGDLSVIGFDDIPLCQVVRPAITTIRQNRAQLGKSAFYALQSQMEGTPIGLLLLHAELIVRESAAKRKD